MKEDSLDGREGGIGLMGWRRCPDMVSEAEEFGWDDI